MNSTHNTQTATALVPVSTCPHLTVIKGVKKKSSSLFEEFAVQMFGHFHGDDFHSDVQDLLDARVQRTFLADSHERLFAQIACVIAIVGLFVFSFI
mgnify:CR=1 FL=1